MIIDLDKPTNATYIVGQTVSDELIEYIQSLFDTLKDLLDHDYFDTEYHYTTERILIAATHIQRKDMSVTIQGNAATNFKLYLPIVGMQETLVATSITEVYIKKKNDHGALVIKYIDELKHQYSLLLIFERYPYEINYRIRKTHDAVVRLHTPVIGNIYNHSNKELKYLGEAIWCGEVNCTWPMVILCKDMENDDMCIFERSNFFYALTKPIIINSSKHEMDLVIDNTAINIHSSIYQWLIGKF